MPALLIAADADGQAGHAALELLELRDVDGDHGQAATSENVGGARRVRAHQHRLVIEHHHVGAAFLGDAEERAEGGLVVDERAVADDGAVRQRGDRALQVEHLGERHGGNLPAARRD